MSLTRLSSENTHSIWPLTSVIEIQAAAAVVHPRQMAAQIDAMIQAKPVANGQAETDATQHGTKKKSDPPVLSASDIIIIQVGERRFRALVSTLTGKSSFFKSELSSRRHLQQQADGSFYLDSDGDIFSHVLRYLRLGAFPVLYSQSKGHDFGMYAAIHALAKFLGIKPLVKWIDQKRFFEAVSVTQNVYDGDELINHGAGNFSSSERMTFQPYRWRRKVYICPRDIPVHRGAPHLCGRACMAEQGDDSDEYEDEELTGIFRIHEKTNFDVQKCSDRTEQ